MKGKKIISAALAGVMALSLTACGGGSTQETTAAPAADSKAEETTAAAEGSEAATGEGVAKEDLQVGFIFIGDENEGYTAAHYKGAKEMQEALGLNDDQLIVKWNIPEDETAKDAAMDLADQGCQIVFANSFGHGEKVIETETLIIATGASAKYLGLPDEHKYAGMGVSACATCDGFFYRKKTVAVVGGGDTACEEAIYLAGLAKQVYLIVRKPYLRASKVMQERVFKTPNITVLFEHNTLGLFGENGVEGAHLVKRMGEPDEEKVDIAIDGFFLAIGHKPNSDIFKPWVDTDEVGYIVTVPGTPRTKVLGVFAAGDVADPHYRQAITAAGSGCKAAIEAERYLSEIGK